MVDPKVMADGFAVSPQIAPADIPALAAAGYKTIINNRPDGEEDGQFSAAEARAIAEDNGINYIHLPVKMPELNADIVDQFSAAVKEQPGPILAHCKSGTRSCVLWTMAAGRDSSMTVEELMDCAAQGGYDLTRLRPLIEQYVQA